MTNTTKEISLKSILRTAIEQIDSGHEGTNEKAEFTITVNDEQFSFRSHSTWRITAAEYGINMESFAAEHAELESIDELILFSEWGEIDLTDFIEHV